MRIGSNFQQNFCGTVRLGANSEQAKRMTKQMANTEYETAVLTTIARTMRALSKPQVKGDFFLTYEKDNTVSVYNRQSLAKPISSYTITSNDSDIVKTAVETLCKVATTNYGK